MATHYNPPPHQQLSRIDELLASRKKDVVRQRQLDDLETRILNLKSVEVMKSRDEAVMAKVAQLLDEKPKLHLQKLFLLNGLTLDTGTALAEALPKNKSLLVLKVLHNTHHVPQYEEALAVLLQQGVSQSSSIQELVLNDCPMHKVGTSALVDSLISPNNHIQRLTVVGVPMLGTYGTTLLGKVVQAPTSCLEQVKLIRCGIDPACSRAIAAALKTNTMLQVLNLEGNPIGDDGCKSLAEALHDNQTLRTLILCRNCSIGNAGAMAVSEMLPHNHTLQEMDLSGNPDILIRGKEALVQGLKQNVSLCSTGWRVTHRHPLRPTVLEKMADQMAMNSIRHQWNSNKKVLCCSGVLRTTNKYRPQATTSSKITHLSSGLLPYYFAKVSTKPAVLYLAVRENGDLFLPHLQK